MEITFVSKLTEKDCDITIQSKPTDFEIVDKLIVLSWHINIDCNNDFIEGMFCYADKLVLLISGPAKTIEGYLHHETTVTDFTIEYDSRYHAGDNTPPHYCITPKQITVDIEAKKAWITF